MWINADIENLVTLAKAGAMAEVDAGLRREDIKAAPA
jgi:hypothetical protein